MEVLVAGALLIMTLTCCGSLFRESAGCFARSQAAAGDLYRARGEMEMAKSLPFEQLPAGVEVSPLDGDLYLLKSGPLYTLRSKYE